MLSRDLCGWNVGGSERRAFVVGAAGGSAALPRVRSTGEMVRDGGRFRIPAPSPFDLPERDLPVDPYFLGYWLGRWQHRTAVYHGW